MANATYSDDQFAVFDDLLPPDAFYELFRWANSQPYDLVHHRGWRKVWRLHDGLPLAGPATWYIEDADGGTAPIAPGGPVGPFATEVRRLANHAQHLVGTSSEWRGFNVTPWIYPTGSGLSLHADTRRYTGAFTYFLHPEWHIHWGGMLIILDKHTPQRASDLPETAVHPPFLSDAADQARVWSPGLGKVVLAKPNRLVFVSPDSEHLITKVDAAAGQNPRISLAGFFHKELPN